MESLQSIFMSFINVIPMLVEVGICVYYLKKSSSTDAILLVIGSGIHLLTSILYSIVLPFFMRSEGYQNISIFYTIGGIFSFIGTIAFLTGLYLLIQKRLETQETSKPW